MRDVVQAEHLFRLPASHVRQQFVILASATAVGALALVVLGGWSYTLAIQTVALVVVAELLVYPISTRRVRLSLSRKGIQGRTFIGSRRPLLSWSEIVVVRHHWLPKGEQGLALYRVRRNGKARRFHSVFVPIALVKDHRFRESLLKLAPQQHPLVLWYPQPAIRRL